MAGTTIVTHRRDGDRPQRLRNQINNALAFPGVFRAAPDVRARKINAAMKLAAAEAIAGCVSSAELPRRA